jgi:carbohydrate-binding DOMON domain-containing protein
LNAAGFIELNLMDRIKTLYEQGSFIVAIRYYGYKVNLYLLNNFYVEVFYNHKLDKIEKVLPMEKHSNRMKFYADQIRLPSPLY